MVFQNYTQWLLQFIYVVAVMAQEQIPLKGTPKTKQPNIVFVLTDDQDLHLDSLSYMPHLNKHVAEQGTSFNRHYCTVALCCPSRASLWTGRAAHNTNVTDVNPPYGGYPKFVQKGFNDDYFPLWMQELGYNTYYVGKLFNAHTVDNYNDPTVAGWTGSEFLLDPHTYEYLNASFTRNGQPPVSYEGQYSTDLVAAKSFAFLEEAVQAREPFFLTVAPMAPHCNVLHSSNMIDGNFSETSNKFSPPVPAERHKHLFEDVVVPRTPHFNPDSPHGASWIKRLNHQNKTNVADNDHFYRSRLRALQAVDEMIDELVHKLDEASILDETYIFFSTDNGYHIGQHRLQPGKQCAFEEDINIPFLARGPGIPRNHSTDIVTTHTDLAPTFLNLAGGKGREDFDGAAIPLHGLKDPDWPTEHVNVEMWGIIMSEGRHGAHLYQNHTYKALRVISEGYNLLYTIWCSGEHELYDLMADPYETHNLYPRNHSTTTIASSSAELPLSYHSDAAPPNLQVPSICEHHTCRTFSSPITLSRLLPRLDALLLVLKTCKGRQCTHAWESLHPDGKVKSLVDALHERFDGYYEGMVKVEFEWCAKGYIAEADGVTWEDVERVGVYSEDEVM